MATVLRAELSEKNKYWIEKHRYYELKHFCLQYPRWKKTYSDMCGFGKSNLDKTVYSRTNIPNDPTSKCAEIRMYYLSRMELLVETAMATDTELASYILTGVTEGLSYTALKTRLGIPCSRDTYYDRYRKFFWLLDKARL